MSANEHIDELLSGFLDGELNAEELRELEAAMAADARLGVQLEKMRELRRSLQSVPKRSLGPNFSARVLAAIEQQKVAAQSVVAQPVVAQSVASQSVTAQSSRQRSSGWNKTLLASAALAASVVLVLFGASLLKPPAGGLAKNSAETPAQEQLAQNTPTVAEPNPLSQNPLTQDVPGLDAQDLIEAMKKGDGEFVRRDPNRKQQQGGLDLSLVLFVLEVQLSDEAASSNFVADVLRDSGIGEVRTVNATRDVVLMLNKSRSINQGPEPKSDDEVELLLLRAPGMMIDKALMTLMASQKEIPFAYFDMSFDLPGSDLFQQLTEAQQLALATDAPIALAIAPPPSDVPAQATFTAKSREHYASNEEREAFASVPLSEMNAGLDEDESSFSLILIRKPAK